MMRIERMTSPLPRECSATELRQLRRKGGPASGREPARKVPQGLGRRKRTCRQACRRGSGDVPVSAMTDKLRSGPRPSPQRDRQNARAERLAAALRANLKRRKQQAKSRSQSAAPAAGEAAAPRKPVE